MRIRSQWVGVELDPTFAQIARLLYPEAQIYAQGFEKVSLSDSSFDLAIGNVPFGNYNWHMIMKVLLDECLSSKQKG
ncbi:MAG: hypothetical protein IM542_07535 [Pseudanabaena sp. M165S2SP1A06QC]|nr:hypothetical protein [Pseudanabaena sp. M090S1SP2A07QC]MCA6622415.1 hypothetical protein [Pseudanabaena sp. M165S2SP1A06QC]